MSENFTPGPWHLDRHGFIATARGEIAQVLAVDIEETPEVQAEEKANANLITAAPELFEACKAGLEFLESLLGECMPGCECVVHEMRAALDKAEGE